MIISKLKLFFLDIFHTYFAFESSSKLTVKHVINREHTYPIFNGSFQRVQQNFRAAYWYHLVPRCGPRRFGHIPPIRRNENLNVPIPTTDGLELILDAVVHFPHCQALLQLSLRQWVHIGCVVPWLWAT